MPNAKTCCYCKWYEGVHGCQGIAGCRKHSKVVLWNEFCEDITPEDNGDLSPFAMELIQRCPMLINLFAEKVNHMINNFDETSVYHEDVLEPIEISHVEYTMEQCGYDK